MTQKQRTVRRQKSDFPIFEYLDMLMPNKLIARFMEIPRHYRWLIISILASSVVLYIFLRVVVGGLYAYLDSRVPRGYDALYLTYGLEERALPEIPDTIDPEAPFVVLPSLVAERYELQIPLSEEELEALANAELEAFLGLSIPAETALNAFQKHLAETLEAQAEAVEASAVEATPVPAEVLTGEGDTAAPAEGALADATAMPTVAPTVDPVQLQFTAVNIALAEVVALNETLDEAESIQPVFERLPKLQEALAGLLPTGVTLQEVEPFNARLAELAAMEPPTVYRTSDCLMASKAVVRRSEAVVPPCAIDPTATFVEQGQYLYNDVAFQVVVAEYPDHDRATQAVKQIFGYARTIGRTGNFSLGPIEYDYVFNHADDLYTFTWSHENWVFSISAENFIELENLVKTFPY
jgi:hypothetical protein